MKNDSAEYVSQIKESYERLKGQAAVSENRFREILIYPTLSTILGYIYGQSLETEKTEPNYRYDYYLKTIKCAVQAKKADTFESGEPAIRSYFESKRGLQFGVVTDGYRWLILSEQYSYRPGPGRPSKTQERVYHYPRFEVKLDNGQDLDILKALLGQGNAGIQALFQQRATTERNPASGDKKVSYRDIFPDEELARYFIAHYIKDIKATGELVGLISKSGKLIVPEVSDIIPSEQFRIAHPYLMPVFQATEDGWLKLTRLYLNVGEGGEKLRNTVAEHGVQIGGIYQSFSDFFKAIGEKAKNRLSWWRVGNSTLEEINNRVKRKGNTGTKPTA